MKAQIIVPTEDFPEPTAILFFTLGEAPANLGNVMSYLHVGQHGEACIAFMDQDCRKPKTDEEKKLCSELIEEYRRI